MPNLALVTQNLTKRFNGLTAVDGLSLDVRQGEVFGLLGPNGAGKTTSINMMCGLLAPDAGEVFIGGQPVHGGNVEVRARVGVCPQQAIFWEKLTCIEQLEFIGEMYNVSQKTARKRGDDLLVTLGLSEKHDKLASTLSGGMQRRLNLALALVHDPEILVLDEPEAGLDPQSRVLVREYIRSLAQQKTIILTTHNMDEADRMADRVAIIDQGKLLVLDTPEALKRTVGKGDVLDLEIKVIPTEQVLTPLQDIIQDITALDHTLTLRAPNIVEKLPAIIESVQNAGGEVGEVHLRANTLEDVFIALTGRRLRQ
ncbi:ABC transporter ATP-binding protein [Chloroflexota bacterium]